MSFRRVTKILGKRARNLSRSARRSLLGMDDVSSDSASDRELDIQGYDPNEDEEALERLQQPPRARSPTRKQQEYAERKRRRKDEIKQEALQQSADIETRNENAVNQMIENINLALRTNVGNTDPVIRFVIRQIINAHGLTSKSIALMAQSRILLSALGEAAGRNVLIAGIAIRTAGQRTLDFLRGTRQLLYSGASIVASSLHRLPSIFSSQPIAQEQGHQLDPAIAMPSGFREAASRQAASRQQVANDELLAQHLSSNLGAQRAAFANFESARNVVLAPASAPPPPPPARAPDAEEDICTICMAGSGIDENGVNHGPLGYVVVHNPPLNNPQTGYVDKGHPNRFHEACLQLCPGNTCPICRADGPVWGMQRPPGQGGGGSRKTRSRSRSKSKSKSKTRRLRKSRKPCKSYKSSKPRSSSRRK